jgi:hypothetical protein
MDLARRPELQRIANGGTLFSIARPAYHNPSPKAALPNKIIVMQGEVLLVALTCDQHS